MSTRCRVTGTVARITGAGNSMGRPAALVFASEGAGIGVADPVEAGGALTVDSMRDADGDPQRVSQRRTPGNVDRIEPRNGNVPPRRNG